MEDLAPTAAADPEIPDKLYFRIGEVARLAGIKPYVLRFWESEFAGLGPKKSGTGHRLYRRKDVELVLEIKRLLYEKRFTIEGARKMLESKPKRDAQKLNAQRKQGELFTTPPAFFQDLRRELNEIVEILERFERPHAAKTDGLRH
ncbi:MAG TPA: MerR family transcriptional regulator [Bryobacteraceae bacterium]|nr:MerR family transcriptional regulator [Bryobacteraceae bacterium]